MGLKLWNTPGVVVVKHAKHGGGFVMLRACLLFKHPEHFVGGHKILSSLERHDILNKNLVHFKFILTPPPIKAKKQILKISPLETRRITLVGYYETGKKA